MTVLKTADCCVGGWVYGALPWVLGHGRDFYSVCQNAEYEYECSDCILRKSYVPYVTYSHRCLTVCITPCNSSISSHTAVAPDLGDNTINNVRSYEKKFQPVTNFFFLTL